MPGVVVHRAPWVLPICGPPLRDGEVSVHQGRVLEVGRGLARSSYVDHDGVLLPGLVNAHAHLQYGPAFADLAASGWPFPRWIAALTARRRETDEATWAQQARASAELMLATGTTCVADVVSDAGALTGRGRLAGITFVEAVGADDAVWSAREKARVRAALAAVPTGAGLSPHSPYSLGTAVFAEVVAQARAAGVRLHPHLAESEAEVDFVARGDDPIAAAWRAAGLEMELMAAPSGRTPTAYVEGLGGLGPDVHIAHGVHVDGVDRQTLRRRRTAVALCTRSNALLQAGQAPVAAYRAEGSPVAVGTDSLASSPDLDLLAELRALRDLARRQGSPAAGLDQWLVAAATSGGAVAMGLHGEVGSLRPGARADLTVVQGEDGPDPWARVIGGRAVATYLLGERVFG